MSESLHIAPNRNWLSSLDGVRGFAALAVLFGHVAQFTAVRQGRIDVHVAVDVFMMVSGFLMTHNFIQRQTTEPWEAPTTWLRFWIRRFFRIAPVYYVLLVAAVLLAGHFNAWRNEIGAAYGWIMPPKPDLSVANLGMHATFLFGLFPRWHNSTALPDWSISLEMQFYVVFPFLMILIRRLPLPCFGALALACGMLSNHFLTGIFELPSLLPLKLPVFAVGMLLALSFHQNPREPLPILLAAGLLAFNQDRILSGLVILFALPIFTTRPTRLSNAFVAVLSNRFTAWLADLSYSIYLAHLLWIFPLSAYFLRQAWYRAGGDVIRFTTVLVPVLAGTFGLALLLRRFVEKPGIDLGKRYARLGAPASPKTARS